jgi:hypothetical protein
MVSAYPLKVTYNLKSKAVETLPTYTAPNGIVYNEVKSVETILNISISTSINIASMTIPLTVMKAQDVVSSKQYYAKNIGMVYAKTTINYQLEDFSSLPITITIPIPQSFHDVQEEVLDTYKVE